jgi:FKBP-type peptidyl-prolyl cis-trans isomerase FkpA
MNRVLLALFIICGLAGCKKSNDELANIEKQAAIDDQIIRDYIATNGLSGVAKQAGVDTVGVWYVVDKPGTGNASLTTSTQITVGYTCRLLTTGEVKTQTNTFHPAFVLGQTIKGWQLGIRKSGVKKYGKVRLLMASRYAYGPFEQTQIGLPANAVLDFDIEIFDVTN